VKACRETINKQGVLKAAHHRCLLLPDETENGLWGERAPTNMGDNPTKGEGTPNADSIKGTKQGLGEQKTHFF